MFDGTTATLTLSEPVWSPAAPAAGDFAVTEDDSAVSVSAVMVASSADTASATITLTMTAALTGAQVSAQYTPNAAVSQRPRDLAGNELSAQTVEASRQVTLSVTAPTIGGYVTGTDGSATTVIECGSGARTDCTATVDSGSVLTLTATPDSGYVFGGWSGACTGTGSSCSVTVNEDAGAAAAFGLARTLTVTAPSNGTVTGTDAGGTEVIACGTDCSATLIDGAMVTLVTTPASGYAFSSWGGACAAETASSCALTMNANKSAGATFAVPVPGPVRNLSGSATGSDVTLNWDAPDTGGTPTGYAVTGGGTASISGAMATVTGLSAQTEYTFTVTASNLGGAGPGADVTVTTEAAPGEVTNLTGAPAGSTGALLSWDAPAAGGTPSEYEVTGPGTVGVTGTAAAITGLSPETEYTWTVKAKNSSGSSAGLDVTVTTLAEVPGAVGGVRVTAVGTDTASLAWNAPAQGGTPTAYSVTGGGTAAVTGTTATIAGLTDGTSYTFSVAASNAGGAGEAVPIRVRTGTPAAVRALRVEAAMATTVHLSWEPSPTGGTPTAYTVTGGGTAVVDGTMARITGLSPGTAHTFSVAAVNGAGSGAAAAAGTGTSFDGLAGGGSYTFSVAGSNSAGAGGAATIDATLGTPGAVGNLTATSVGTTSVSLSWNAPASGGTPASYTVTGGGTASVSGTTATITGLTDATAYTFSVTASNAAGTGIAVQIAVTTGVPGTVQNLTGNSTGTTTVSLDWDAPATGGTATGYSVTASSVAASQIIVSGTSATVTGLSADTSYTFTVKARNSAGTGPGDDVTVKTQVQSPGPVQNLTGTATGETAVSLDWDVPATGGTATGYSVTASGVASTQIAVSGTGATVAELMCGTSYTWSVTADNGSGSSTVTSVTVTTPWPSLDFSGSATGATTVSLDWDEPSGCATVTGYSVTGSGTVSVSGTGASVTGLTANTAYSFSVTASTSVGTSPAEMINLTTPPNAVGNLHVSAVFSRGFTIAWDAPTGGATSYTISGTVTGPGTGTGTVGTVNTTETTATFSDLDPARTFTLSVTANGAGGASLSRTVTASPGGGGM